MKKKILATVMTLTLGAAMLTACGSSADETVDTVVEETAVSEVETTEEATDVETTEVADTDVETTEEATDVETTEVADTEVETTEEATTEAVAN